MIVDYVSQLDSFQDKVVFLYPILTDDRLHHHHNPIIGFVVIDVITKQTFTISNNHQEGVFHTSDLSFLKNCKVYCYDTAVLKYAGYDVSTYIDAKMQYYLYTNNGYSTDTPKIISHYNRLYNNCYRINELVSLTKHEEIAMSIFEECWVRDTQPGLSFYQNELLSAFHNIECNGLHIDQQLFKQSFGQSLSKLDQFCYTQYNYYTLTGRPSNRFGGINFAALNKEDGSRDVFTSRHADGLLVELDFNSYHPRLIASLIDYDFKNENVYEHLATHYANTSNPTPEQIESAKEATFRQLYGGIQHQYLHIPFFAKTNDFANYLWKLMDKQEYIESPISGRRIYQHNHSDLSVGVLFNYFIQMYETESNVLILDKIHQLLSDKKTKPVLYTYDSILFDVEKSELNYLLETVIPSSIDLNKYPVKIKQGTNYKNIRV